MQDRQEVLKSHRIVQKEYEQWNSYRVQCACGWKEKAVTEGEAMGRYRTHVNKFLKTH